MDPATSAPRLFAEHVARYRFAAELVQGRYVLDAAAGTGYGAAILLGGGARSVVAAERDSGALARCRELSPGALPLRCDVTRLPLRDACVEACVSLETLEHVADGRKYVAEFGRVLVDGGLLVLSTPNRLSRLAAHTNPFHIREFAPEEVAELLAPVFDIASWAGQDVDLGGPRSLLRRWAAVSPFVALVRRLLPAPLRRWAGAAAAGNATASVIDLDERNVRLAATIVIVARRRQRAESLPQNERQAMKDRSGGTVEGGAEA